MKSKITDKDRLDFLEAQSGFTFEPDIKWGERDIRKRYAGRYRFSECVKFPVIGAATLRDAVDFCIKIEREDE